MTAVCVKAEKLWIGIMPQTGNVSGEAIVCVYSITVLHGNDTSYGESWFLK